ncbi:hypothetical protein COEREDRAFT_90187 [Coemansia reversa NRRL 1564]|uniref:F-box domain-containing protein n=1 Tax=Coemansia reversa (strain ATCC 12441 / NRRL 1564) TaxID=763665 RepID=A0A2G5B1E5_COERN|nr:hypothetical protein COEREDRAFT_90187 [Coemansia reversa NRRL 1564]|eukprot:PIA12537.1 hypothetical protein COEREDRAFT_90187 [Coemansia reversa NRRL 1564]
MSGVVNAQHAGKHASTGSAAHTRRRTVRIWPLQLLQPQLLKLPKQPQLQSFRPAHPHAICGGVLDRETGDSISISTISGGNYSSNSGSADLQPLAARLPSDLINVIADAVVLSVSVITDECCSPLRQLGVTPEMSDEAQAMLRKLSHVCHDWRRTLLSRAWRSVALTGAPGLLSSACGMYAFTASCTRRLVVPWGAMAAPVSWSASYADGGDDMDSDVDGYPDTGVDLDGCSSTTSTSSIGYSVDSNSRLHLPIHGKAAATPLANSTNRLCSVFGNQSWPAVEHLDMSFMPLICYQGFAAHVQRTMPNLRTLRIGGFVPAAALADVLLLARMPLEAIEIAGSVWADTTAGRRRSSASSSASSWRSTTTTVAAPARVVFDYQQSAGGSGTGSSCGAEPVLASISATPPAQPLALLAVTADALRSPAVFAFAMAQAPTLRALHLLDRMEQIAADGGTEPAPEPSVAVAATDDMLDFAAEAAH